MFEWIKQFLRSEPPPIAATVDDPILGTLIWSEDDEAWVSSAAQEGAGFELMIGGTPEPNKALLEHAKDILHRKEEFVAEVLTQVQSEGEADRSLHSYRDEIAGLRVERVFLDCPDRPSDGMIGLSGGWDYRAWRCDYTAGKPIGLGFDS